MRLSRKDLATMIDHTNLDPNATKKDIIKLCSEARKFGFKAVCVQPWWVRFASKQLAKVATLVATVISFPFGFDKTATKVEAARQAAGDGASELDMVMNRCAFKARKFRAVQEDIAAVSKATKCKVKVIIEACDLPPDEIKKACKIAKKAGADFVKSNTGFGKAGARREEIELISKAVGKKLGVKAAGGIRNAKQAINLIKAGANRIGASKGPAIVKSL